MQMPALLVAILLAGGNPVWDQQKTQMVCGDRAVAAVTAKSGLPAQPQTARAVPNCRTAGKPVAEAATPAAVQAR